MSSASPLGEATEPASAEPRWKFLLRVVQLRLRFVLLLAALAGVLLGWQQLRAGWNLFDDWWTAAASTVGGVSPDTEYFCPMCPGVLTQWPEKCPVCKMPLVRRKKGDAALLPEGVLARMQLTPQRVQLAGVQTSPAQYRPLTREFTVSGRIVDGGAGDQGESMPHVECEVSPEEARLVALEQPVRLGEQASADETSRAGRVVGLEPSLGGRGLCRVRVAVDAAESLANGRELRVTFTRSVAELEPFCRSPRNPAPLTPRTPRVVHRCAEHPEYLYLEAGRCPYDNQTLEHVVLTADQRVTWSCPSHEKVSSAVAADCHECGDRRLIPSITTYVPAGQVLAIPVSSVVETGQAKLVFIERMPGMFDGVAVSLGARCGEFYPVFSGLAVNDRVVTAGALLLDAESRLNAGVAGTYFGAGAGAASGGSAGRTRQGTDPEPSLDSLALSPVDRAWAAAQRTCPVTKLPLGGMGELDRVFVRGRLIFLCCEGCRGSIAEDALRVPEPRDEAADGRERP